LPATAPARCPARENRGNHDIKNFTRGSRVFYPVRVPGALFSRGDLHFSRGTARSRSGGAIEMGGFIDFHVDVIQGGMATYGVSTNPILIPGNVEPRYSEFVTFIGIGVDHTSDTQLYNDATVAYRNACLNAVDYLMKFGYSRPKAYLLLGAAPIEGRIIGVVDIRTPAVRPTCPRPSSTSTSGRRPRVRSPATGEAAPCRPDASGLRRAGRPRTGSNGVRHRTGRRGEPMASISAPPGRSTASGDVTLR
jgi:formamidase